MVCPKSAKLGTDLSHTADEPYWKPVSAQLQDPSVNNPSSREAGHNPPWLWPFTKDQPVAHLTVSFQNQILGIMRVTSRTPYQKHVSLFAQENEQRISTLSLAPKWTVLLSISFQSLILTILWDRNKADFQGSKNVMYSVSTADPSLEDGDLHPAPNFWPDKNHHPALNGLTALMPLSSCPCCSFNIISTPWQCRKQWEARRELRTEGVCNSNVRHHQSPRALVLQGYHSTQKDNPILKISNLRILRY